jgi:MFS transporter, ACS family, tartrate transporter
LQMNGALGLKGWQWLFLLEGVPTILLGAIAYFWLADKPSQARWLTESQRANLTLQIEKFVDENPINRAASKSVFRVLIDPRVLYLSLVSASTTTISTALAIWQPVIVRSFGLSYVESGLVTALPYAVGAIALVYWGRRSDIRGERLWHNILPMIAIIIGFLGLLVAHSLWPSIAMLTLVMVGTYGCKGPFWAMCSERLPRNTSAAALAQISAVGNLFGFFASYLIGAIRDATGSYPLALVPLLIMCVIATLALILEARVTLRWSKSRIAP